MNTPLTDWPDALLWSDAIQDRLAAEAIDPRDEPNSAPNVVAIANNLASLGFRPESAPRFLGYPMIQTHLEIAAQYARVAEYAQAQIGWSLDRVGWLGVIDAIGPLQAPYLATVLQFLEIPVEDTEYD